MPILGPRDFAYSRSKILLQKLFKIPSYFRSGEDNNETESKSWYHYPETKDRIDHFGQEDQEDLSDDDEEESDLEETAKYKLEPEAKDVLRDSWKHLQNR